MRDAVACRVDRRVDRRQCDGNFIMMAMLLMTMPLMSVPQLVMAQSTEPTGIGFSAISIQKWEMGLEISSPGKVSGVTAVFPIPIDWPEQKIKLLAESKTKNVTRVTTKFLGKDKSCKVALVTVPVLFPGDVARATFLFEIQKFHITEPTDTSNFRFSKSANRKQRSYLGVSPFIDTNHPRIKDLSKKIGDSEAEAWLQAREVFDWVRANIEYEFDEKIKTSLTALEKRKGDCEELSSIFIAICRGKGIPARAVWIPGHTYPEFFLEDQQGGGHWFPCQIAGGNDDFGRMPEDRPILQKGDRFKVPGHQEMQRYARPTLSARSASASPSLKWIMKKVE
mgnify:FL=1|jgi:hypothetical protein